MEILKNADLIEKINELHRIYTDDYDLLVSVYESIFSVESNLKRIIATMSYKTLIAVNSIILPLSYMRMIEKCSVNLLSNIADLMNEYNVPTNESFKQNSNALLADNDYFVSYNKTIEIAENMLNGKTFEYYQNMKVVSLFLAYKGVNSCVVNLSIPYGKTLLDEIIQVANIYTIGKDTSNLDADIKTNLIVKQKYKYPNFEISISKNKDYYKIVFKDKSSANDFLNFINNANYGKNK